VLSRAGFRVLLFDLRGFRALLGSREDGYVSVEEDQALERRAGSAYKRLALFSGGYHGWDLVELTPYHERASHVLVDFLRRR